MSKFKVGDRVETNGATPRDNTKQLMPHLRGTVVGYDTDGKAKVWMDGEDAPWYIAEHELDRYILTFKDAEKMVRAALAETKYADAHLVEYGGGDGDEDIKPFRIARTGHCDLGATCYPEGGMLFWVWDDDGEPIEYKSAAEAIAAFDGIE